MLGDTLAKKKAGIGMINKKIIRIAFIMNWGLFFRAPPSLAVGMAKLNSNQFQSLNESFARDQAPSSKTLVYGIINLLCPCSRDSLQSFEKIQTYLPKNTELIVIDIGAKSKKSFDLFKKNIRPSYSFYYDPSQKSVAFFHAQVTPSAYIVKDNQLLYQSAVIDPSKDPSPNYLAEALLKINQHKVPAFNQAFGCQIEKSFE